MTLRKRIMWIDLLVTLFLIGVPLIVFGAFQCWPTPSNITTLYWISFAVFPILHILWIIFDFARKPSELAISYVKFFANGVLLFVPLINLIFALIPLDSILFFIIPLIIDIAALIAYVAVNLLLNFVNKKMVTALKENQSERVAVEKVEDYENDDGSFKGAKKGK